MVVVVMVAVRVMMDQVIVMVVEVLVAFGTGSRSCGTFVTDGSVSNGGSA